MKNLILLIFILSTTRVNANNKDQIINKLKDTLNLNFDFEQNINGKIEFGNCTIQYPKKMFCAYDQKNKVIVSNGKSLLINSNKNDQFYRYALEKTPLNLILDKEFIIEKIDLMKQEININSSYKFQLDYENLEITIFFDEKNLNLRGWTTIDIYQNKVETNLSSVETNILVDEKIFDIRNYTN